MKNTSKSIFTTTQTVSQRSSESSGAGSIEYWFAAVVICMFFGAGVIVYQTAVSSGRTSPEQFTSAQADMPARSLEWPR
jgi:hypothetical protein